MEKRYLFVQLIDGFEALVIKQNTLGWQATRALTSTKYTPKLQTKQNPTLLPYRMADSFFAIQLEDKSSEDNLLVAKCATRFLNSLSLLKNGVNIDTIIILR